MSRKHQISEALQQLTQGSYFQLNSHSETVMCRESAHALGLNIKIKRMGTVFVVMLKENDPFERIEIRTVGKGMITTPPKKYVNSAKHWDLKTAPVGMSGVTIVGLDWFEEGHQDIPEDWLIYDNRLQTMFKPRFVKDPSLLTNVLTDEMGLPPTKEAVTGDYYPMTKEQAEIVFETLKGMGK